jgi:SOS response regulatory protein OraA/RecX
MELNDFLLDKIIDNIKTHGLGDDSAFSHYFWRIESRTGGSLKVAEKAILEMIEKERPAFTLIQTCKEINRISKSFYQLGWKNGTMLIGCLDIILASARTI